ncbi:MAG: amino acid adenylation domain-containing protein [Crocosphaera sp.]|nr:amino acid adenylation domain-containing protein [Crocosphaera sp.]
MEDQSYINIKVDDHDSMISMCTLELPIDYPRLSPQPANYKQEIVDLSFLKEKKLPCSLSKFLLTTWVCLLYRYHQQENIILSVSSNYCENQLSIQLDTDLVTLQISIIDSLTFESFLNNIDNQIKDNFINKNYDFNQSNVAFFEQSLIERYSFDTNFDLILSYSESINSEDTNNKVTIIYNSNLFTDETITRVIDHLTILINSIIEHPQQLINKLPLLTESEKNKLFKEWNRITTDYSSEYTIDKLFEIQAKRTPNSIAITYEDQNITYQELDKKSNQLAHYLNQLGVKTETLVGLYLQRSPNIIITILAILKAGGAYLPLDPSAPPERVKIILEDAKASLIITENSYVKSIKILAKNINILSVDNINNLNDFNEQKPTNDTVNSNNLAYIIYTSGSTGKPKGVLIPHRNVIRLFTATQSWFKFNKNDVWTLFHSYAFDFSVWEIWGALFHGGRLVIIPYDVSRSPKLFYNLLCQEKVTILNQTPSAFQQLIQVEKSLKHPNSLSLRYVIFGGEALEINTLEPWFNRHGDKFPQLINMYGITETTVHVTYYPITITDLNASKKVIGCAIPDLEIYVLNSYLQPVPVGIIGEIYVGGAGLARGYLNRQQLTNERFIQHPFSNKSEARLYKTGDLARYLPNGDLEYIGRIDNQVKIRGFRIELGEIESLINQHNNVKISKVIIREDTLNDKQIIAYIIPNLSQYNYSELSHQIRDYLKQQLPDYMIPGGFVILESFPLTTNGKIDVRALPKPDFSIFQHDYIAPRNDIEETLVNIWIQVLKLEKIGINDNFFELGGHSLLGTQVISLIRENLKLEITISLLFEYPTIAQLSEQIQITEKKENFLLLPSIQPRQEQNNLPLSFAQQRLWFLNQLAPNNIAYNLSYGLQIEGLLNVRALEKSIKEIIKHHETLRTNFIDINGKPTQIINQDVNWELPIIDLQSLADEQKERESNKIVTQFIKTPFNLSQDSLFRVQLLRLNQDHHILLFNIHHIIFDGWSFGILFKELQTLYTAYYQDSVASLSPLSIQYADFSLWQKKSLSGQRLESQLNYWQQKLGGTLPTLELPTDYPRPRVQTYQGSIKAFSLSSALTAKIKLLSNKEGVSLFMTLLTAFKVLLYRYSGQEDIIIGTPIAGRNRREIEALIGFFVNTLALRSDLSDNPSFRELLSRVKRVCLEAYNHQDVPFEQLVEVLQPERDLSHTPIFQVMFALQNTPMEGLQLPDLSVTPFKPSLEIAQFDLTLSMEEDNGNLTGEWEYNTDLFASSTIERISEHFQILLSGILANPEQTIGELPILSQDETYQIVTEWNQTKISYPQDKLIHQLFEEQVEKTPDAVAVIFENQQLTYKELNQKANQLANYLKKLGVNTEQFVGLYLEPSLLRVVGLLAIFKVGGIYLPLDPVYPQERLKFIIEDSGTSILLTQTFLANKLLIDSLAIINIDRDWINISQESKNNPNICVKVYNLAYVIYTSGSTGIPKGVLIEHQALLFHCQNIIRHYNLNSSDRILQFASISFDVSLEQILPTLAVGATLIINDDNLLTPSDFSQRLIHFGLTVVDIPPVFLTQWLQFLNQNNSLISNHKLRLIISGGEILSKETVKIWAKSCLKNIQLINAYGPTEATITTTTFSLPRDSKLIENYKNIPIGRPLPNRKIYILDSQKNPVPVGVAGELYIGGESLARGYLHQVELTDEKFIFYTLDNSKLSKTGDLARYLPDGNIEFLGRIDNQVKIRGFRIELGEIENLLNKYSKIKDSKVITAKDSTGNKILVAYLIANSNNQEIDDKNFTSLLSQVHQYLKQKLPDYMIPTAFMVLESFPLTPNGKIDYRAFPEPDFSVSQTNYVPPRTPTEEIIAKVWSQVLNIKKIGIDDNFFMLGGHSLLATQVISRIRENLKQEIPLRLLFEYPTIAQLSQQIKITEKDENYFSLPSIQARQKQDNIPLSFAQESLWFLAQLEPNNTAYNMPFMLKIEGSLNIKLLEETLSEIMQRHEILRTNFISINGQPNQIINNNVDFKLPILDLTVFSEEQQEIEAKKIAKQLAATSFNLEKDSLFKGKLLQLNSIYHILLFNIHHIIFDGWSYNILQKEIAEIYQKLSRKNKKKAPEKSKSLQYGDFSVWQRQYFTDETLQSQVNYWKQQLGDNLPVLQLPTDFPRPQVQTYQGATHFFSLSPQLTANINDLCQQEEVTLFMTLLAVFKILLYRYSGQKDIIVGTPIAYRNFREIEDLIGFFVNTVALRTNLGNNPTFRELISQIRQVTLDAYTHQDLPFETLVKELKPERNLSYNPIFQVWFNMINLPQNTINFDGLQIESIPILETTSKFDLSLYIEEETNKINLRFVYNKLLFNSQTIERMGNHFQQLLERVINHPETRISNLSIFTETERYELSHRCNLITPRNSFLEFSKKEIEQSISSRFKKQVEKYSNNIAVKNKQSQYTYKQLNNYANQIAQALLNTNSQKESKVALFFDHDLPMIAAILGVLQAGKVYVPLDSQYPKDRILYILEDSLAEIILTNNKNLIALQQLTQGKIPIINIDNLTDYPLEINPEISPDNLAYILYTSGSTGKPKGVIQNHRNVLHFIKNYTNNLHISANDRLSLLASYSFDAAIIDIFSALLNGATLCLFDIKQEGLDNLSNWLGKEKITIYHSTPTVYRYFMEIVISQKSMDKSQLSQIRLVVLGGEMVVKEDVELYQSFFADHCLFVNGLGSTESSFNLQYLIDKTTKITQALVPVGYRFEDTDILLLDENGNVTDICGEIAIRSPYVALGYWQNPELTKTVFLDDPQGQNKRIYRTGDWGRLRNNGAIECLGRKDFQVKIRGFRIELGEIEAVLNKHPQVKETVVIHREDSSGEKRLIAYIVPQDISLIETSQPQIFKQFREFLRQKLPNYMIPAKFVLWETLPLTPNGKIDRRLLAARDESKLVATETLIAPRNPLELQLSNLWQKVLGIESMGVNDNFFDLGGHSLLAVRLVAEIEQALQQKLPLETIFQFPTVEQLAEVITRQESSVEAIWPMQSQGSRSPLFLIHVLGRGLKFCRPMVAHLNPDQPVYGLNAQMINRQETVSNRVEDLATYYIRQMQIIQPKGPYFLAGISFGGKVAYEMAQQLQSQGETVALLALLDTYAPGAIEKRTVTQDINFYWNRFLDDGFPYLLNQSRRKLIGRTQNTLQRLTQFRKNLYVYFALKLNLSLSEQMQDFIFQQENKQASMMYIPKVYSGNVSLFVAQEEDVSANVYLDPQLGWGQFVTGDLEVYEIPGSHLGMLQDPCVQILAEKLTLAIEKAETDRLI